MFLIGSPLVICPNKSGSNLYTRWVEILAGRINDRWEWSSGNLFEGETHTLWTDMRSTEWWFDNGEVKVLYWFLNNLIDWRQIRFLIYEDLGNFNGSLVNLWLWL